MRNKPIIKRVAKNLLGDTSPVIKKEGIGMAKTKKIERRAWTSSDLRELKSLAKKKTGVAKISKGSVRIA